MSYCNCKKGGWQPVKATNDGRCWLCNHQTMVAMPKFTKTFAYTRKGTPTEKVNKVDKTILSYLRAQEKENGGN